MKRFLVLLLVAVMAVPALFAVDVKASVNTELNIWHSENGFSMTNKDQNDDDLLSFTLAGEKAGAYFRLHSAIVDGSGSTYAGTVGDDGVPGTLDDGFALISSYITIRKLSLWLKPIDMLKITVGNVDGSLFTETIDWWQVADGIGGWSNDIIAAGEGGIKVDLTPIEALSISASFAPGYGNNLVANDEIVPGNVKWGIVTKYTIDGVGVVGAGFKFDQAYTGSETRLFRAGFQLTAVEGLSAFLQATVNFNNAGINGIAIDPFVDFTAGALNIKASIPVTLYQDDAAKSAGIQYDVHVSYSMETVSPYFSIEQNSGMVFGGTDDTVFTPQINLGITWGYDVGSFDLSFQLNVADPSEDTTWSIPFKARVTM